MRGAVGLVDVLVVAGTTTLCSAGSGVRVVATLGSDGGRFVTIASSCLAIFRRMGLRLAFFNVSSDSKSSSATVSACCVGLSVGSLQCCG